MDGEFTLFGDLPRTTIVIKWMRFYQYYPGMDKAKDKPRRDELKDHLKLPPAYGQKLASFIINRFNSFRKRGFLSWDGQHHVEYHSVTDVWLSATWDGEVEQTSSSPQPETRSSSTNPALQKRPASHRLQQVEKRQKTTSEIETAPFIISISTNSNGSKGNTRRPTLPTKQHADCHQQQPDTSDVAASPSPRRMKGADQIPPSSSSLPPGTRGGFDESAASSHLQSDLTLHYKKLSRKLETVNVQSTLKGVQNASDFAQSSGANGGLGDLGPLRDKEQVCLQALRTSMKELESAREVHRTLCQQYGTLKAEVKVTLQILEQETRRQEAASSSKPPGEGEADFTDRIHDVVHDRGNLKFVLAKKEEKLRIERQLRENTEVKFSLKVCIKAKKFELRQLQDDIRERLKMNARSARAKVKLGALFTEFEDVNGHTSSSSVSPIGSAPESVQSELSELDEEDTENQIDSLLVDCTM
jgi:hypothetical protein